MVSRRSDPLTRKRCPRACDTCKKRKERCDGKQPCGRCVDRSVSTTCSFQSEHGIRRPRRRELFRESSESSYTYEVGPSPYANRRSSMVSSTTEPNWMPPQQDLPAEASPTVDIDKATSSPESPNSLEIDHSRLLRDRRGRFMFIGDAANLSFLREIRVVIKASQGSCPFVDDPMRSCMVEAIPDDNIKSFEIKSGEVAVPMPTAQAKRLVEQFFICTNGLVDLLDEADILRALPSALSLSLQSESFRDVSSRAMVHLVLAIGAQNSPSAEDDGGLPETLFGHGRYLVAQYLNEDASVQTAQLHVLIAVYLLGACRRNAAFICLAHAVRSAYALGVHQQPVSALFPPVEQRERERLWNSIRAIDLFTSVSLGRPPSTTETRRLDESSENSCEAISNELYAILETIMNEVYSQRKITSGLLTKISARQRNWAAAFSRFNMSQCNNDGSATITLKVNIGQMHLRQAYYWSIMLLTRPFLVDRVTAHASAVSAAPVSRGGSGGSPIYPCVTTDPSRTLVHACVGSAIKTISLLEPLVTMGVEEDENQENEDSKERNQEKLPTHLPVLINAAFHSALVLGFAYFGDLYTVFPLEDGLATAHRILQAFSRDSVASRNAGIIRYLRDVCAAYYRRRHSGRLSVEADAVSQLFGQICEPLLQPGNYPASSWSPSSLSAPVLSRQDAPMTYNDGAAITTTNSSRDTEYNLATPPDVLSKDTFSIAADNNNTITQDLLMNDDDILASLGLGNENATELDLAFPMAALFTMVSEDDKDIVGESPIFPI